MQQTQWLKTHPAWDGRGVTIVAVVEGMGDLSHPSLQTAIDGNGKTVPKVAGIIDPADYSNPNPANYFKDDGSEYSGEIHFSVNPALSDGTACPKPASATEKVGVWQTRWYAAKAEYCAAWDESQQAARLDLNKNGTFADEKPLFDFNQQPSYVKVGYTMKQKLDPSFAHYFTAYCLRDPKSGKIFIHADAGNHVTMCATTAAGTGFLAGKVGGVAPAARLLYVSDNGRASDYLEGIWLAASRPDVDLLTSSNGVQSFPTDPQQLISVFLDRISAVTAKPILQASGNHGAIFEQGNERPSPNHRGRL
jgi:hypothetical protein